MEIDYFGENSEKKIDTCIHPQKTKQFRNNDKEFSGLTANPVNQKGKKDIWCEKYEQCLDTAIERNWKFFCCDQCECRGKLQNITTSAKETYTARSLKRRIKPLDDEARAILSGKPRKRKAKKKKLVFNNRKLLPLLTRKNKSNGDIDYLVVQKQLEVIDRRFELRSQGNKPLILAVDTKNEARKIFERTKSFMLCELWQVLPGQKDKKID